AQDLTDPHEPAAQRKAVLWCAVAGAAQIGLAAFPVDLLAALGYPFILPAVALLHARAESHRRSGAVLATITGTAAVIVGIGASTAVPLRPAALVLLGMWWWTLGKMGVETGILPRRFSMRTAALGALVIVGAALVSLGDRLVLVSGDLGLFDAAHLALGAWLLALAAVFARR
ncbi:MAG: hypothetical protein Q7S25_03480, partial [Candidatus Limnocylindria bacterium]|nr:hypothetical protein [Candidatus Limnocylindria bacterium]